jgi:hypothetical protein
MHILDVAKQTAKSFPESYEGAGAAMGISPNVLRNKVSKANETHHLSLLEAMDLMREAEDARVPDPHALLRALAAEFGFQLVREGEGRGAGDLSIAEKLMETTLHTAELGKEFIASIADGQITPQEMDRITECRRRATRTHVELEELARGLVAQHNITTLRRAS